jgi:myosin heavy subunit
MDKKNMGKILCQDQLRFLISFLLLIFSMTAVDCYSVTRDIELLDTGYSYYLSYQPEKAAEEFRTFLKEFPQSSAKDAALYWLGKSLIQLREFKEARKVFSDLKQQFPESPFSLFTDKEMETIEKAEYQLVQSISSQDVKNKTDEKAESKVELRENVKNKAAEDKEKKKLIVEEENKKDKELLDKMKELEEEKKKIVVLLTKLEKIEEEKNKADDPAVKELEKESKKAKELEEKLRELDEAKKKAEKLESKVKELEGEKKKAKGLQDKVKELEEEKEKAVALQEKVKELEKEKTKAKELQARIKKLEKEKAEESESKAKELEEARKKADELKIKSRELDNAREKAEKLQKQVKELEGATKKEKELQTKLKELDKANEKIDTLQEKVKELEEEKKKAKGLQERATKLTEEKEKIGALQAKIRELEEENKQTEELRSKVKELEETRKKADGLQARLKELEEGKKNAQELPAKQTAVEEEKKKSEELQFKIRELADEKKKAEELQAKIRELEGKESYLLNSSVVLNKLGMKDVLWRSGNIQEDLINENMLYQEAKKLNIAEDLTKYRALTEKYKFNREQEDYLKRYLTICNFIDLKLKDMSAEDVFEQLIVEYDEDTRYTKIVIAAELQKQAKSGMSFEEIYNLYPDLIAFRITGFEELPEWIQEKVRLLQTGELGVIWSEDGYRILKRSVKKLSLKSCEEIRPETRDKIKSYITEMLHEIRGETKSKREKSGG